MSEYFLLRAALVRTLRRTVVHSRPDAGGQMSDSFSDVVARADGQVGARVNSPTVTEAIHSSVYTQRDSHRQACLPKTVVISGTAATWLNRPNSNLGHLAAGETAR